MAYFLGDSNQLPQSIEGRKIEKQTHYNRDTTLTVMTYQLGDSNRHPQSIEGRKIEQQTHYNRDTYYLDSTDLQTGCFKSASTEH